MDIKKTTHKFVQKLRDTYLPSLTHYKDFQVEFGRNYAKIISVSTRSRASWGFIVINPGKHEHLRVGDLLKSASWKKPETNKARGNILDGTDTHEWTGPVYLSSTGVPSVGKNTTVGLLK
jgi:hypothetical protein